MQIGDVLIDTRNNQAYIVKAFMPKYPKRVLLLDLDDGKTFSILKSDQDRDWETKILGRVASTLGITDTQFSRS